MTVPTGRDSDKFMLRLPDGMRYRIKAAAEDNNRSMNAEIVAALEEKYPPPKPDRDAFERLLVVRRMIELHHERVEKNAWSNAARNLYLWNLKTILEEVADQLPADAVDQALGGLIFPEDWDTLTDPHGDGFGDGDGAYGDSDGNGDGMGGRS